MEISHLLLGGGGLCGFEMLGVLHGFQWRGETSSITHISSISIGTYCGIFFMMDTDAMVAYKLISASMTEDACYISPVAMLKLPYTYDLINFKPFMEPIKSAMKLKWPDVLPETITFGEFCSRCKKNWSIILTDLDGGRPVVANPDEHFADVPVLDLISASMALPFVLPPVCIKGIIYVDGGLTCDNPWLAYQSNPPKKHNVLKVIINNSEYECKRDTKSLQNIGQYVQKLMQCGLWNKSSFFMHDIAHVITLQNTAMPMLPLRITKKGLWLDITPPKMEAALLNGIEHFESWHCKAKPSSSLQQP